MLRNKAPYTLLPGLAVLLFSALVCAEEIGPIPGNLPPATGPETYETRNLIPFNGVSLLENAQAARLRSRPRVSTALVQLAEEYSDHLRAGTGKSFKSKRSLLRIANNRVVVDAVASEDAEQLQKALESQGMTHSARFGRIVSGRLPIQAINGLEHMPQLNFIRPAIMINRVGNVTSQGDLAARADIARTLYGIDGIGITVGTLSDSYNCLGGAAGDVASGDLPSGVVVLEEIADCTGATDEGRAMMQIIADVAPGASQAFHTAFNGLANFAQGIVDLANAGAEVIVDDIGYANEPMFQDSIIAQAVDTVAGMGVSYFSSAGNSSRNSYESDTYPSGSSVFGYGHAHDFDPGPGVDFFQKIYVPVGEAIAVILNWDSPYFSVSGSPGSPNDLHIFLTDDPPTGGIEGSIDSNIGSDPIEVMQFYNDGTFGEYFNIVIEGISGPVPDLIKYIIWGSGSIIEYSTDSSTVFGHPNAAGAEAVGAARYSETPRYGVSPPLLEWFSSAGGTPILFDLNGDPVNVLRQKPEIVCPDGGNTTFFGSDYEPDGYPNFFGTSAAAPHAAGIAALMLDLENSLTPGAVYSAMETTAVDMESAGFDYDSGHGLCKADKAVEAIAVESMTVLRIPTPPSLPEPGGSVSYAIRVTSTGNTTLTLESLTDSLYGNLAGKGDCSVPQTIEPGNEYRCDFMEMVTGNAGDSFSGMVTATGSGPISTVTAYGISEVTISDMSDAVAVFRNGQWYLDLSGNNFWDGCTVDGCFYLGMAGDQAVTGDWDGDGDDEIGVFRNGAWYLDVSGNDFWDGCSVDGCLYLGMDGDQAVVGDWDGDGDDEIGVFRNGAWYLDLSGNNFWDGCGIDGCFYLGMAGDQAVAGDWDGDGDDEIGVFRNGQWFLDLSGNDFWDGCTIDGCVYLGMAGDQAVAGDWDGNGDDEIGVFRSGAWYLDVSGNDYWDGCSTDGCVFLGMAGDQPVCGKW